MKIITTKKLGDHPLEEIFNIESGTTITESHEVIPSEIVSMINYDDKDNEIEEKLEEIYSVAMGQVTLIGDEMDRVEGKFKARIGEVTANMLSVALNAVKEKSILKMHKDKLGSEKGPSTVNNNLVLTDRNEILRMMLSGKTSSS